MGPSRFQQQLDQTMPRWVLHDLVASAGFSPPDDHCHPFAVTRVPGDGEVYQTGARLYLANRQGEVALGHFPRLDLLGQRLMGGMGLGDHH